MRVHAGDNPSLHLNLFDMYEVFSSGLRKLALQQVIEVVVSVLLLPAYLELPSSLTCRIVDNRSLFRQD
jgi:hypothetical protein